MVGAYVCKCVMLRISKGFRADVLAAGISQRVFSDRRVISITIIVIYPMLTLKIGTPLINFTLNGNSRCFTYIRKQSCATSSWTISNYLMSYYVHFLLNNECATWERCQKI
jgi:hypothetical protein